MIRQIQPLNSKADFDKLTDLFNRILNNDASFRFLSYSLIRFDKETIISITEKHKENGIDYIIDEQNGLFTGILAYKMNRFQGFELFLLAVDTDYQKSGVGQKLITECMNIATKEGFKCIDSFVFADNKNMLRLLIKNDFMPVDIQYHMRADGMDLVKLRKYIGSC